MTPHRGLLIALEGIDGSGKSTLQRSLARRWRAAGWRVVCRREPGHPELARAALARSERDPWSAAMFFTIDRWRMRPALERILRTKSIVLLDRSLYSTMAYQGSRLSRYDFTRLRALQRRVTVEPDRVVLLDLPVPIALRRLGGRGAQRSPVERTRTLNRVARAYRTLSGGPRWAVVDARQSAFVLAAEVDRRLGPTLRRWSRPSRARR